MSNPIESGLGLSNQLKVILGGKIFIFSFNDLLKLERCGLECDIFEEKISDALQAKHKQKIYSAYLGRGTYPFYIITEPYRWLASGDLCISLIPTEEPHTPQRKQDREKLANQHELSTNSKTGTSGWENLLLKHRKQKNVFFKIGSPLCELSEQQLLKLSSQEINQIIDGYLTEDNDSVNSLLVKIFKAQALRPNFKLGDPQIIGQQLSNSIIFTPTKTTKTTLARKVGIVHDKISLAGLCGFSTATDVNRGALDKQVATQFVDELQEERGQNLTEQMLSYLEDGTFTSTKGKQQITIIGLAPLVYLGNPPKAKKGSTLYDYSPQLVLMEHFRELLKILTSNYPALGSRIALILFDPNIKPARGGRMTSAKLGLYKQLLNYITERTSVAYTRIIQHKKVHEWLNREYPERYKAEIKNASIQVEEVDEFWKGSLEAYRHTRGLALRIAIWQHIKELFETKEYGGYCNYLQDNFLDTLLDSADEALVEILDVNAKSLRKMASLIDRDYVKKVYDGLIRTIDPLYLRYFTLALIKHMKQIEGQIPPYILLEEVRESYLALKEKFSDKYSTWSIVKEKIGELCNGTSRGKSDLLHNCGIKLTSFKGLPAIHIADVEKFSYLTQTKTYEETQVTSVKSVTSVVEPDTNITKKTNITPEIKDNVDTRDFENISNIEGTCAECNEIKKLEYIFREKKICSSCRDKLITIKIQ